MTYYSAERVMHDDPLMLSTEDVYLLEPGDILSPVYTQFSNSSWRSHKLKGIQFDPTVGKDRFVWDSKFPNDGHFFSDCGMIPYSHRQWNSTNYMRGPADLPARRLAAELLFANEVVTVELDRTLDVYYLDNGVELIEETIDYVDVNMLEYIKEKAIDRLTIK